MMKNLPIGIQSFEDLRSNDYLYVDKTENIYRLITKGKIYFLSRPRRFGKSLLISTLDAIFSGRKDLFEGLWIYDKWDWTQQFPVIRIDWTRISHIDPEKMMTSMIGFLKDIAKKYNISLTKETESDCFRELISSLYEKFDKKVVILIDEYDKPVTSHLFDEDLSATIRIVHDFYQVMKGADDYIRFILLTGVSKFSGLSVFSALNNPDDISMNRHYASICGYTQEELENNFSEYIDEAAKQFDWTREEMLEKIRYFYDGYSWDG
ncbi:MAG: AAA family ATPase, partial [Prevotellaceae bacterium]|nr:AAA family ATPase [Prevotellaceae bacterium]